MVDLSIWLKWNFLALFFPSDKYFIVDLNIIPALVWLSLIRKYMMCV